jgi:hypothetical protein
MNIIGIPNRVGQVVAFTSVGCTYTSPIGGKLWNNDSVVSTLSIDVSDSIGTPNPSYVLGTNVTVIALDLATS